MRSHRAGLTLGLALVVGMLTAGCGLGGSSTPPTTTAVPLPTTTHAAPVPTAPTPNPRLVGFTPCAVQPFDEPWLCRTIDVPLDRAHLA